MASTGMGQSFKLTSEVINNIVPESIGAYVLGFQGGTFIVSYVGRSDNNLRDRLLKHIGEEYTDFKFIILSSVKEAFERECIVYHDFGESKLLDNKAHPARPEGTDYQCPRCNIFQSSGYYI
jgi:hypothetical protein